MSKTRHTLFLSILFSGITLLSACGSKGNLYDENQENLAGQKTPPIESRQDQKQEQ